jgi:hypothetical protein
MGVGVQAGIDVKVCLGESLEVDLARTAQEGIVRANVKFNIAFAGLVASLAALKSGVQF